MLKFLMIPLLLIGLAACAGGNRFVLLEEEDGSTGAITVRNEAGSRTVSEAGTVTQVASAQAAPSEPEAISQEEIDKTWGATLQANPLKPRSFLIYFITGTDILTEQSRRQLPDILDSIKEYPAPEVAIIGHTDTVGSAARNAQLARDRAAAIRDVLIGEGLDRNLIEVDSHGESNLLVATPNDTDEPRNRRVEVTVR
ncbi:OmpA family protein [Pelagibius sp. CAU 1746]|uniref:OmpA family protein n=1 Tax=Pelagibius sp. CAU 1746 TaxID=3140370 RepID=UPI00325BA9BA